MTPLDLFDEFRNMFPEIAKDADKEHIKVWEEVDPKYAYSWFESLANAINRDMICGVEPSRHKAVFEYFRSHYARGDEQIRNCIDASFVENLFWKVSPDKAKLYWLALPEMLKDLYVKFHRRSPA